MMWGAFWLILGLNAGFVWGCIWHHLATQRQRRRDLQRRIWTTVIVYNQTGHPVYASRDAVDYVQPQWRN